MPEQRLPDFFIVGAPKAGTTALATYLAQHPDVFMPRAKELHYFGSDLDYRRRRPSRGEYLASFAGVGGARRVGEASVGYLYSALAPTDMLAFNPAADILIMLRDPIEMIQAQHNQLVFSGDEDIADLEEALAAEADRERGQSIAPGCGIPYALRYRWTARYSEHVERYLEAFGRERVHISLFDDFRRDTAGTYATVLEFLGCDPLYRPAFEVVNPRKLARSRVVQRIIRNPPAAIGSTARRLLPRDARVRLRQALYRLNTSRSEQSAISDALRAELRRDLLPDVERLAGLIGRDLSGWLT